MSTDVRTTARKFVAATSREALRLVREALGAEAIGLNHRAIPEGVEIVAMVEDEMTQAVASAAPVAPARAPLPAAPVAPAIPVMTMPAAAPAVVPAPAPAVVRAPVAAPAPADLVMNELHSMRGMLEEQLASVVWNERQRQDPVRGRLLRTLLGAGFSAKLSKAMLEKLPTGQSYAEGMAFARAELIRAVPVHKSGVGSAVLNAMRQVGGSIGIALMGAIVAAQASGRPGVEGFMAGFERALIVAAVIAFAGSIVAFALVRQEQEQVPAPVELAA